MNELDELFEKYAILKDWEDCKIYLESVDEYYVFDWFTDEDNEAYDRITDKLYEDYWNALRKVFPNLSSPSIYERV